ncbi:MULTISPECIES: hypothetical protein [unclassified Bradyrhizobium]
MNAKASMNAKANVTGFKPLFHPAAHYASASAVLDDAGLSTPEKRIILSSWASDMYAVESQPALREIPGMGHPIRLTDILAALRKLDDDDPPPRGGAAMRLRRPSAAASGTEPAHVGTT